MQDRSERLSAAARQSLDAAVALAARAAAPLVGTEHLLLGVLQVRDPDVEAILAEMNLTAAALGEAVRSAAQPGAGAAPARAAPPPGANLSDDDTSTGLPDMPLTPRWRRVLRSSRLTSRLKQALAFAEDDARSRGAAEIEPVHLLLAAVRDPGGAAARIARPLGLDYDRLRRVLRVGPSAPPTTPPAEAPPPSEPAPAGPTVTLPRDLYDELRALAAARETTVDQLVLRFVRLGLLALAVQDKPDGALIVREGNREREIVLL
jgi:ATP-dependent Clp protease ATP-binding subunit ClpA